MRGCLCPCKPHAQEILSHYPLVAASSLLKSLETFLHKFLNNECNVLELVKKKVDIKLRFHVVTIGQVFIDETPLPHRPGWFF